MKAIAIAPVLNSMGNSDLAGGKDIAAIECINVLLDMEFDVGIIPLASGVTLPQERVLSSHNIGWPYSQDTFRVKILPTGHVPSIPELIKRIFKTLLAGNRRRLLRHAIFDPCWQINALGPNPANLIHNHQTKSPWPTYYKRRFPKTPIILTHHTNTTEIPVEAYDAVVFPSRWMYANSAQAYPQFDKLRAYIPYFVSQSFYSDESFQREDRITFIGVLDSARKGLDLLICAIKELQNSNQIFSLDVVGTGPFEGVFREQARKAGISARFHGRLNPRQNAELLKRSKIFCMPSRNESFGIAYIEALACGTPIIGYAPTVNEISEDIGLYIGEPFDASTEGIADLALKIAKLFRKTKYWDVSERMEIQTYIRRKFSLEAYHKAYRDLFTQFLPS